VKQRVARFARWFSDRMGTPQAFVAALVNVALRARAEEQQHARDGGARSR
jgi:hypothetical protein